LIDILQMSCYTTQVQIWYARPILEAIVAKRIEFLVEKGRVLVPVGEPCSFACRYCYTRGGEVGPARVDKEEILTRLQAFLETEEVETIQFGYDGDPFVDSDRGIYMLNRLANLNKNVNFSTKALLQGGVLEAVESIKIRMEENSNTLSALISLSCWDAAPQIEPHTPTPNERMITIRNLKRIGIPTLISVRPILPHIPDSEYEQIIEAGLAANCDGFILGPLYANDRGQFVRFIPQEILSQVPSKQVRVPWSPHLLQWTRYEDEARLERIKAMVEQREGRVFTSSADAMQFFALEKV
jgi:DNA repair photolyase